MYQIGFNSAEHMSVWVTQSQLESLKDPRGCDDIRAFTFAFTTQSERRYTVVHERTRPFIVDLSQALSVPTNSALATETTRCRQPFNLLTTVFVDRRRSFAPIVRLCVGAA